MKKQDFDKLANFTYSEVYFFYKSKGLNPLKEIPKIKKSLFVKLQKFRDLLKAEGINRPILFNSITDGRHAKNSEHGRGNAVDVRLGGRGRINWNKVYQCAVESGFKGIGYYPTWKPNRGFHLDNRKGSFKTWTRTSGGKYTGIIN